VHLSWEIITDFLIQGDLAQVITQMPLIQLIYITEDDC